MSLQLCMQLPKQRKQIKWNQSNTFPAPLLWLRSGLLFGRHDGQLPLSFCS